MNGGQSAFDEAYRSRHPLFGWTPTRCVEEAAALLAPRAAVYELGCGDGRDTLPLLRRGFRVHAVDLSTTAIAHLRREAAANGLADGLTAEVADVALREFPARSFDAVVGVTVLDHLERDIRDALLRRLMTYLRSNGLIVVEAHSDRDPSLDPAGGEVSEFASAIRSHFRANELLSPFIRPGWRVLSYSDRRELDTDHGSPHHHGFVSIIAQHEGDACEE
jgi:cyclopropane fatty-acyl-phospholipid synthase-like methyltransferase